MRQVREQNDISWTAPKTSKARLNLQLADEKPKFYSNPVIYIDGKTQDTMRLPSVEGDYVLRWYNDSDKKLVVERPIKLIKEAIIITAPDEAGAGTEIDISWTSPKTSDARIGLQLAEDKPEFYSNPSIHTKGKKEGTIMLPSTPGDYVLRWFNNSDREPVTERPIKLVEKQISLRSRYRNRHFMGCP
ncbi:hypothetical protein GQR58_019223 [Nymphon striatum]|nr:hypothetical protein GQR58_019223 [Nymphon striatum]